MYNKTVYSIIVHLYNEELVIKKAILNLGLVLSINIMMFGVTLGTIGVMGQYIGKIFDKSKGIPSYIVESAVNYKKVGERYEISS